MSYFLNSYRFAQQGPCDPYWPYVLLNLQLDGTNGSTSITDSSDYAWGMSCHGNASISTAQSKFGGASAYFDGSGDAVQVSCTAANNSWDFGTADFTMELFCRPSVVNVDQEVLAKRTTANNNDFWLLRITSSGAVRFYNKTAGTVTTDITSVATLTANTWYHIAVTRVSGVCKIWINGANNDSVTSNTAGSFSNAVVNVCIGAGDTTLSAPYQGYIDSVRVTAGIARYTADFTPPTEAFAGVECGPADPFFANLVLLAPMEGSNGSSYFVDLTARHTLVPVSASVSTSGPSFPAGALSVSGTTSYLRVEGNESDWKTSGELTVECFAAHTSFATGENFLVGNYGGSAGGWQLYITGAAGAGTEVVLRNGDALVVARTIALSTGVKRHYAFCRAGDTGRLFVDGVQVGASFDLTGVTLGRTGTLVHIGVGAGYPAYPTLFETSGYIGWVRVTSAARYTADFTVPSTPFPAH